MTTPTVWTEDRIEKLRELYGLPIDQEEIARRLSETGYTFSLMSINSQVQKLRLHRTPALTALMKKHAGGSKTASSGWTAERTEELRLLVAQGLSGTQISLLMGLSRNQVVGRSHRMGFRLSGGSAQEARKLANVSIRPKHVRERKPPTLKLVEGRMSPPKAPAVAPDMSRRYNGETVWFMHTQPGTCRYIVDGDAHSEARTCCARALEGYSYCATHKPQCITPPQERKRSGGPMNATWRASR